MKFFLTLVQRKNQLQKKYQFICRLQSSNSDEVHKHEKRIKLKSQENLHIISKTEHEKSEKKLNKGQDDTSGLQKTVKIDPKKNAEIAIKVGGISNFFLMLSKGLIGYSVASTALIADAVNSMGDLLCDGVVYITVNEARKRATPDRPWGRGKIEPLGTNY
jgi:Co/Zn/Cd efflux system component